MRTSVRRLALLVLLGWPLAAPASRAEGPTRPADPRDGFRQLGKLRAGLAFQAREEERDPLKAAHLYLQAALAFQRAGGDESRKALVAGVLAARPLRATWVHPWGAVAMTFLAGGKQVLTCGADGDIHVWDAVTGREVRSFQAEDGLTPHGKVAGAVFNRDRSRMLLRGYHTVQLWDVSRGKLLHTWKPEPRPSGMAFLRGDRRALIWGFKPPTRLVDLETGKELRTFDKGHIGWGPPALTGDEARLLTADEEGAYLWDVARADLLHQFRGGREDHLQAALAPDGKRVAVCGYADGPVRLFDAATGRPLRSLADGRPKRSHAQATGVEFSPDGARLLTRGQDGKARLWDLAGAAPRHTFPGAGWGVRFSPDGKHVITFGPLSLLWDADDGSPLGSLGPAYSATFTDGGSRVLLWGDGRAELWDVRRPQRLRAFGADPAAGAVFSPDGSLLLVGSRVGPNGTVRLWDLRQPDGTRSVRVAAPLPAAQVFRDGDPILSAELSRDETRLLTCDEDGKAHVWDVAQADWVQTFAHGRGVRGALFDPKGVRVLTWGAGGTAKLWDARTGKEVRALKHPADLRGAAFGPGGSHALTWDVDYTARWWDLSRAEPVHKFEHDRDLFGARLDPRGLRTLTWGLDGAAKVWDLASGRLVRSLAHAGPVFGAAFGADEGRVWTWAGDGFHEWDVKAGKELRHLPVKGGVAAGELSRDNKRFLRRNAAGLIDYWDITSGKALATFYHVFNVYGDYESVTAGTFSPDQTRALTWAGDGSVYLWDLTSGLKLKAFRHEKAVRGAAFTGDGSRVLTWGADGTARLWEASAPRSLAPDDQLLELEVRSGLRIDEYGKLQGLSFKGWQDRRKELETVLRKYKDR